MKFIFLLFIALGFTACGPRGSVSNFPVPEILPAIQIEVSSEELTLGEPIEVTVRITAEERLALPPVEEWLDPAIDVLDSESETIPSEDLWIQEHQLTLTLFQITNITLFAESKVATLDKEPVDLSLPFQKLSAVSVLEGEDAVPMFGNDDLPDFRGPEALRRQRRNIWISIIAGILVLVAIVMLWWYISRKPKIPPPPVPAHLEALRRIHELTASDMWKKPDVDACALELSFILRLYIEERFEIHAPGQTTEEFLSYAEAQSPWSSGEQEGLNRFFDVTDSINYAAARPDRTVLEELLQATQRFVERTHTTNNTKETI